MVMRFKPEGLVVKKCFVYFVQMGSIGPIKIGVAKNVERRLESLQTGNPYKLKLLTMIECTNSLKAYDLERKMNSKFSNHNIRGEWFNSGILNLMHEVREIEKEAIEIQLDIQQLTALEES